MPTILLMEDDVEVRKLLKEMLERFGGYNVIMAEDEDYGVPKLADCKRDVDLLITNISLPASNKEAVFKQIRTACPGVKVLFISSYSRDMLAEKGIIVDDSKLITKPIKFSTLLSKVQRLTQKRIT